MDRSVEYATQAAPVIVEQLGSLVTCTTQSEATRFIEDELIKAYNRGAVDATRQETPTRENK